MDYDAKLREAKALLDRGNYSASVVELGKLLESMYVEFYDMTLRALPPQKRAVLQQRELDTANQLDRAAKEKGFRGFTLGAKVRFFRENKFIDSAEQELKRSYPRFRAFDPNLAKDIRNEAAHDQDEATEDEANFMYAQVRLLLNEVGLLAKPEVKPVAETGGLRSWKDAEAIPHQDILDGNLQMDTYAADIWGVARNDPNTPAVYRDPARFFEQTYLTSSLKALLIDVLKALGGGAGDRVLQLRTPFGGGKTHTLIALYHVARNRAKISGLPPEMPDPGACAVAAIQCEKLPARQGHIAEDGTHIHTLWGEVFYQLGGPAGYALIADEDANMTAPGGETISALLRSVKRPALILLDEVLNHVETAMTITVGESTLGRQLMVFLKSLTEAVAGSRNAVLVYSLQASVREAMGAEGLLDTLDHLVSRVDAKREPVSGPEVMRVVQRRLFKSLGDENVRRQAAAAYAETFRKVRQAAGGASAQDAAQIAQDAERLQARIMESYPFHPDLLDLMYHRWGTLASYQRTRGALQFLASVVYDLWTRGRDLQPLIGPGDVPLEFENTRNAFFTQVGEREPYAAAISSDLIGGNAKTNNVDRRIASDSPAMQRYRAGTRLATSALLYSFGAREGEERGIFESELVQAAAVPGLERTLLITALNDLRNELLYLHYTGKRYRFETQANLNKMIDDEMKKFDVENVTGRLKLALETALRVARGAVLWPEDSGRVNDRVPMLQVVYLPLDWANAADDESRNRRLTEWLEYCGSTRREYKNGLAFALPGYSAADSLRAAARTLLALESLKKDHRRYSIGNEQMHEIDDRIRISADQINRGIVALYDRVAVPTKSEDGQNGPYAWRSVNLQSRSDSQLHARVTGALADAYLISERLTPERLITLTHLSESPVQETDRITDGFFSYLDFVRLTSAEVIKDTIGRGVSESKLGYSALIEERDGQPYFPDPGLVYFGRHLPSDEIDLSGAYVVYAALAREIVTPPPSPVVEDAPVVPEDMSPSAPGASSAMAPVTVSPSTAAAPTRRLYRLSASAEKGKVSKLFRAIQNLGDKADRVHLELNVSAESDGGFDPVWLRNAVEEPLDEADIDSNRRLE